MAVLKGLKPEKVFAYFEKLCSVPHGSGNTKIISDLCVDFAKELGLKYRQEPCNNVVIWKPASPGRESAEPIILQGHIDMVCAKTDDCTKDMTCEGLDLMTDGEWIWADKTSLGGDNCIAVAMILAILSDDTLVHPPIEAVFTVDEEVGMDGAFALDCSDLKGKKLLNLDSLSAFQPVPYLNVYASTKAFVLSYTRSLAREVRPRGIRVMAVSPGWVKTEFFDHALQTSNDAVTYYNRLYEAKDVMKTALHDLYRTKKDVSIHGFPVRWQVRLVKLLPHKLVMDIWMKQQKHNKLPDED